MLKLNLVVAQGVHEGKVIPVPGTKFMIGRDPECQLRPASPSVSKQHCVIEVVGDTIVIKDFGSTNGTIVNDVRVEGEIEIKNGDRIKVGPLDFVLKVEATAVKTPPPRPAKPKPAPAAKEDPDSTVADVKPISRGRQTAEEEASEADDLAALMLAEDGGDLSGSHAGAIPDGATVMDMEALGDGSETKKTEVKADPNKADTSGAAANILSRYMRRPRN